MIAWAVELLTRSRRRNRALDDVMEQLSALLEEHKKDTELWRRHYLALQRKIIIRSLEAGVPIGGCYEEQRGRRG